MESQPECSGSEQIVKTLLTIAGFDPSNGAGATADLQVFAAHGFFGTSALTALTVQSTIGVKAVYPVESSILIHTLTALVEDIQPAGVKIGMLATAANVMAVTGFVQRLRLIRADIPVVLDPVMISTSGRELLDPEGVIALRRDLLPIVDWATPNFDELGVLLGRPIDCPDKVTEAARELAAKYIGINVAATGGHLRTADDLLVLADGRSQWMCREKIVSNATHGTGCAYSSALLCGLAQDLDGLAAALQAKDFVSEAIRRAPGLGRGKGPMNLLWPLSDSPATSR